MDLAVIIIGIFAAGVAVGYLAKWMPSPAKIMKVVEGLPPPQPVKVTHWEKVPDARHPSLSEWIVTVEFSDGRKCKFRGDATVWNHYPSGARAGTTMDLWLLGRWKAHLWSLQGKEGQR